MRKKRKKVVKKLHPLKLNRKVRNKLRQVVAPQFSNSLKLNKVNSNQPKEKLIANVATIPKVMP
ncbi:hypothetical protein D271_02509 [Ligilactobacillus saerimneri 30a]|uniref:Uncharacterized protein n=1 Tax=Ligilactobacillus saerimneri 30a TaxID=1227363 RepID=M5J6I0_9LACO|nr:hypothetical protein D271_02509 [Ligilactobacillus saerimneri 30a]